MPPRPFAFVLLAASAAFFAIPKLTEVAFRPVPAVVSGALGATILLVYLVQRVSDWFNTPPTRPWFRVDRVQGGTLVLACDGDYESCQSVLRDLSRVFGATWSRHLDPGPGKHDKDKGYWNISMFDDEFFLMREGGSGIYIWGATPPADPSSFLRVALYYNAVEFVTWQQRLLRSLRITQAPAPRGK